MDIDRCSADGVRKPVCGWGIWDGWRPTDSRNFDRSHEAYPIAQIATAPDPLQELLTMPEPMSPTHGEHQPAAARNR
jgi:hypothetical protein